LSRSGQTIAPRTVAMRLRFVRNNHRAVPFQGMDLVALGIFIAVASGLMALRSGCASAANGSSNRYAERIGALNQSKFVKTGIKSESQARGL
jgi:hypothetical protein